MAKGQQRTRDRSNQSQVRTITIPITSFPVSQGSGVSPGGGGLIVNAAVGTPGWGTAVIQGLPRGNIVILEAFANLQFSSLINGVANPNVPATFTGAFSIGTTATADATLASTDANVVPSTAMTTAVASVAAVTPSTVSALNLVVNNSDSVSGTTPKLVPIGQNATSVTVKTGPAIGLNLNFTIANVSTAPAPITINGSVTITYALNGNY
jgi:hypothetical protein